jgi:cyclohexanecarboxylate-CoA ligase
VIKAERLNAEVRARLAGAWHGELLDAPLRDLAASAPSADVVIDRGRAWTAGELDRRIDQAAQGFQALGVRPGDVVSWQLPNRAEAFVAHYGALRAGAVSNPIIPIYRAAEVGFILRQARSKVLLVPRAFRGFDYVSMAAGLLPDLPDLRAVLVQDAEPGDRFDDAGSFFDGFVGAPEPIERNADDVCLLLYTSGTTGAAKGVMHTHNTLHFENQSLVDFFDLDERDVVFMPSPLTHITGVLYGLHLPLLLRSKVVLQDVWDPAPALSLIERHGCTFMLAATPFLFGLVDHPARTEHDLSAMRIFACGGADVPPELIRRASASLDCLVARVYGSSEFPTATCSGASDPLDKRAETDGRPIGVAEVRIVGKDGGPAATDQAGEIYVRGPELFLGYLDASLDAASFDEDGFFATGDLGRLDADGYLTVVGRTKDIIIRGGENLSAKEVEDHLFEHDEVVDVAVVGLPDRILGERVAAFVVPRPDVSLELDELAGWLRARGLAMQKLPELVVITDGLPRTASGKIQKFRLREMLADYPDGRGTVSRLRHPEGTR